MTHSLHVPLKGAPVSHVPTLEHEFDLAGLRVIALPPGKAEISYVLKPHIIDVNINAMEFEMAVNSDRLAPSITEANTISWGPPATELQIRTENVDWGLLMEVSPEKVSALFAETSQEVGIPQDFVPYRAAPQAAVLGRHLITHLRFGSPDRLFVEGVSLAILACSLNVARTGTERGGPSIAGIDPRIARAIDYIEAHLGEDLSVAAIAQAAAMSPSWFQSAFRSITGRPVFAYVRERRLARARILLADRRLSLSQIAFACGFSSHSHMTRLFRARYGASPRDMR